MTFKERFLAAAAEQDQAAIMGEFGIDKEKASRFQWYIFRAIWTGVQIGATGALVVILILIGGWALWRGVAR